MFFTGDLNEDNTNVIVMDIMHQKHPAAQTPKASALVVCDTPPVLEDVEIAGSHISFVPCLGSLLIENSIPDGI